MRKKIVVASLVVVLILIAVFLTPALRKFQVDVPEYQQPGELVRLQQGWTEAQWLEFHHTPQGTRLIPYGWFMALEQPCFSLFGCELFADEKYLGRFGFLRSRKDPKLNPDGLPVGFARQEDFYDPINKATYPVVGLTCAACHTGELQYGKYAVRIEGGPAMIEVAQFQKALGLSLGFTQLIPGRYGRFEKRVLGDNPTDEQRKNLKDSFDRFLTIAKAEQKATGEANIYANPAGFARTDALTRIGNQVFAVDMQLNDNFAVSNAAVRFPQIWDASWFNWVQYNSSISDPLVRNIGEALGVRAAAKLYGPDAANYDTSVHIPNLRVLEELLSGPEPYKGLTSPKWPHVFPALDPDKVRRGSTLYKQHCQGCHLPPPEELQKDLKAERPTYWEDGAEGRRFLKMIDISVDDIGTDPHEAMDFKNRTSDTGDLKQGRVSAEKGLDLVTNGIANRFFMKMNFSPAQKLEWSAYRNPSDVDVRAEAIYKARPLNGIWAVAPYLHNGSVRNLYELLGPPEERASEFWLGTKRFDPVKVGYETSEIKGGYLYDIRREGNSNKGHEFRDAPRGKGVIGPALSPDERMALIEYLKSM
jgi:mono/diheme cytochrome c family protein